MNRFPASGFIVPTLCVSAAVFACAQSAAADVIIVSFDLTPTAGKAPPTIVAPDVIASDYVPLGGAISSTSKTHYLNGNTPAAHTIESSVQNEIAGEFTVTAAEGLSLNLASLQFGFGSDNAEADDYFAIHLRSSLDSFATDIGFVERTGVTGTTMTAESLTFPSPTFQGVSGSITFRLFLVSTGNANNEVTRIGPDVVLNGVVVPEPAAATVMLVALAALRRSRPQ